MPDPTQVRVRLPNGALKTFPAGHPATEAEGVEVLDVDAVDEHGMTLPTVYPDTGATQAAEGFNALTVPELKAEIDRRNQVAGDGSQLISKSGNKADLVAALAAHDAAQASAGGEDGNPDDPSGTGGTDPNQEA